MLSYSFFSLGERTRLVEVRQKIQKLETKRRRFSARRLKVEARRLKMPAKRSECAAKCKNNVTEHFEKRRFMQIKRKRAIIGKINYYNG